ncbi:metal-dependent hydrolase family protein [Neobacillus drentensis]|uniref:metal-dependent hydrolase family protein n=1 Tax=Neobacillus drentensis TaxID=220684 RepID=UPI003003A3FF
MKTLIYNVTLFDGKSRYLAGQNILFDENGILEISSNDMTGDADHTIDGTGLSCLPGLIDLHVHLTMDGSPNAMNQLVQDSPGIAAYRAMVSAQSHIEAGVVTVRNCGAKYKIDMELRNAIEKGIITGPRIFACGQPITMTGGHCHMFGIEADGVDEVRKAARSLLKEGADFIKLMATGGGLTPGVKAGSPQLSEDELAAACSEARKAGKRSAAHAQGCEGIKNAIRAGVTTIEHGVELDHEAIQLMKQYETYLVATLAAPFHIVKNGTAAGIPEFAVKKNAEAIVPHRESFKNAYKAGVKIAAGTDAGTPFNVHGDFVTELMLMREQGMSVLEVIHAATYVAAEVLGIEKETGSLEVGKLADLILVEGNPYEDFTALRRVKKVFKEGICMFEQIEKPVLNYAQ